MAPRGHCHHLSSLNIECDLLKRILVCCLVFFQPYKSSTFTTALPNPPAGLEASDVTATSLKLSWDVFASSGDLSYIVQYKPVNKRGADYKEKTGIVNPVYTVGHLMAFTRYEFRVIAVTNIGRGSPSDTIEVTTGELG